MAVVVILINTASKADLAQLGMFCTRTKNSEYRNKRVGEEMSEIA